MSSRGTSRHMGDKHMKKKMGNSGNGMNRLEMLHMHHKQTLWVNWLIILLGTWMIMTPATFDYGKNIVQPAGGRSIWLSDAMRVSFMKWSDIISGALLIIFGWRSLTPNRPVSMWVCCFIGIWLTMAPIIFWAPASFIYLNGTFVGALIIALTILIPGMPNMIMYMKMGSTVPPGWSYNPSSWPQRWSMIVLAFLGWIVSRYLGAYQLGYIDHIWDPFFNEGSKAVLTSDMSESIPVSDGALGGLAYTFEFLMGWMGSPSRWRTMPWMVTIFGILVIPLGLVHIFLVISQPLVVGYWCTLCLLAAAIMLPMIPLEIDEVIAMAQHMKQAVKEKGERFWSVFWKGGTPAEESDEDEQTPELMQLSEKPVEVIKSSLWGMSSPWTLTISTLLGIWLMFAPAAFSVSIEKTVADICHLGGALIVVTSVIAMGEVVRLGRYFNILLGLFVSVSPWFFETQSLWLNIINMIVGLAVIILAFPQGIVREKYGSWDRFVK